MSITYHVGEKLSVAEFIDILERSTLAERRPVSEPARIAKMLEHGNLMITARDGKKLVGIARSLTDFAFCCYLSDLAVDKAYQKQGIGKELIERTRDAVAPHSMVLLLSAPAAMGYYPRVGMPKAENAFMHPRKA
jgi:predicted N-acetyltransferase YhbS